MFGIKRELKEIKRRLCELENPFIGEYYNEYPKGVFSWVAFRDHDVMRKHKGDIYTKPHYVTQQGSHKSGGWIPKKRIFFYADFWDKVRSDVRNERKLPVSKKL